MMTNEEIVRQFTEAVFNAHELSNLEFYMREDYIQHNPTIKNGIEGFRDFAENRFFKQFPNLELRIMHLYTVGNIVISHNHAILKKGGDEAVVVDIYRIQDGKLAEHWDVIQHLLPDQLNSEAINRFF
jgi:predicted SnoaL-like aldol condensation-catalyzing enzyme